VRTLGFATDTTRRAADEGNVPDGLGGERLAHTWQAVEERCGALIVAHLLRVPAAHGGNDQDGESSLRTLGAESQAS
jgi:hypothetical protein